METAVRNGRGFSFLMTFIIKILISALLIAFTSWLAGAKPGLSGFLVALPLTSVLSILMSYAEFRDMEKINEFATSILLSVPLSLVFFIPFILNRWFKMNFPLTFCLGIALLAVAYLIHTAILKSR